MSDGWKLGVLKRRQAHLEQRLEAQEAAGASATAKKYDVREWEALDWAIAILDPMVPRA